MWGAGSGGDVLCEVLCSQTTCRNLRLHHHKNMESAFGLALPAQWSFEQLGDGADQETRALNAAIGNAKALVCASEGPSSKALDVFQQLFLTLLHRAEELWEVDTLQHTFLTVCALLCRLGKDETHDITSDRPMWRWAVQHAGALHPSMEALSPPCHVVCCVENLASFWRSLDSVYLPSYVHALWCTAATVLMGMRHTPHIDDLLPLITRLIECSRQSILLQVGLEPRMGEPRSGFAHHELPAAVISFVQRALTTEADTQDISELISDSLVSPGDFMLCCMKSHCRVDRNTVLMTYGSWTGQLRGFPTLRDQHDAAIDDLIDMARFGSAVRAVSGLKFFLDCYVARWQAWQALDSLRQRCCPVIVQLAGRAWAITLKHPHSATFSVCICPCAREAAVQWLGAVSIYLNGVVNGVRVV